MVYFVLVLLMVPPILILPYTTLFRSPTLEEILGLREQVPALGIKVAPGIPHHLLPAESHTQWVSVAGDVVEAGIRSEEHTSELQSRGHLVCRLLLEKKKNTRPGRKLR